MKVWIDAADENSGRDVFGLTLVERQLRMLRRMQPLPEEVCIDAGTAARTADTETAQPYSVRYRERLGTAGARLDAYLAEAGDSDVVVLAGEAVIDARLLEHLWRREQSCVARGGSGPERTAALRIAAGERANVDADCGSVADLGDALLRDAGFAEVTSADVPSHIRKLRRDQPFYLFRVTDDATRERAERFLFQSNYKASTDALTKYAYPPLVWAMTRPLARLGIHPNVVTIVSIVFALGAVPAFAAGEWLLGLVLAYAMTVLDSVDGKLARLTYTESPVGNLLDHGLDVIHPPLWYFGWAWGLAGTTAAPVFQAAVALFVVYVLDRLATASYSVVFGRSLHAHAPIDGRLRTFIARRNINLVIFTIGLILGYGEAAVFVVLAWQTLTLAYHAGRSLTLILARRRA